jgi:hypothetical protein
VLLGPNAPSVPAGKVIHAVNLHGSYPETQLVVVLDDALGRPHRENFALWEQDAFTAGTDHYDEPESAVGIIIANLEAI